MKLKKRKKVLDNTEHEQHVLGKRSFLSLKTLCSIKLSISRENNDMCAVSNFKQNNAKLFKYTTNNNKYY